MSKQVHTITSVQESKSPTQERPVNRQLELIANEMDAAVTRCTRDLRYDWVNERYAKWIQRPINAIFGCRIQEILGSEAFLRLLPYFERVLSGETVSYEEKIAFGEIGERWISAIYTPTFDLQGMPDGWVAIVRDTTSQKATEAALLDREKLLADEAQALSKLNDFSLRLWETNSLKEGLDQMLPAVMNLLAADKGNVQLFDRERNVLTIAVQCGFEPEFLERFREVSSLDDTGCGRALRKYDVVVVEDLETDHGYAPYREVARDAGYRSVISAPLIAREGNILGVVSVHFARVHRASEQQLQRLNLYVRQAADFIERCRREEALRQSEERYRTLCETLARKSTR